MVFDIKWKSPWREGPRQRKSYLNDRLTHPHFLTDRQDLATSRGEFGGISSSLPGKVSENGDRAEGGYQISTWMRTRPHLRLPSGRRNTMEREPSLCTSLETLLILWRTFVTPTMGKHVNESSPFSLTMHRYTAQHYGESSCL
jgi:hypothetical protein